MRGRIGRAALSVTRHSTPKTIYLPMPIPWSNPLAFTTSTGEGRFYSSIALRLYSNLFKCLFECYLTFK